MDDQGGMIANVACFPVLVAKELEKMRKEYPEAIKSGGQGWNLIEYKLHDLGKALPYANNDILFELLQISAYCQRIAEDCGLVE